MGFAFAKLLHVLAPRAGAARRRAARRIARRAWAAMLIALVALHWLPAMAVAGNVDFGALCTASGVPAGHASPDAPAGIDGQATPHAAPCALCAGAAASPALPFLAPVIVGHLLLAQPVAGPVPAVEPPPAVLARPPPA